MERLQGPINHSYLGEQLDVECLERGFANTESFRFEEEAHFSTPSLEEKMPFLQMLQSVESSPILGFQEPNFQTLLRLQHLKKPWDSTAYTPAMETQIQALELESCVTHDVVELHSPVKSERLDLHHLHSTSCLEGMSSECNQERPNSLPENCGRERMSGSSPARANPETRPKQTTHFSKSPPVTRERRKRKRTKPAKNKEEVESQRMTHIAVERNRRRQMNDHLNALRSLMPTSYIQRGDQASIIGGAIDFVKELEQLLESLEAQKRMRKTQEGGDTSSTATATATVPCTTPPLQFGTASDGSCSGEEFMAEKKSEAAEIEVTAIQSHVNLKIQCQRRPGQLLKAILALEDLGLTVLHLNITSSQSSVLYSFNLKIEDDFDLGSADEIAGAVHQIFSIINGS